MRMVNETVPYQGFFLPLMPAAAEAKQSISIRHEGEKTSGTQGNPLADAFKLSRCNPISFK